jgi:S-adenosylmethionine hydrolase
MSTRIPPPRPWRPSGVVSLLTDWGLDDPYVGVVHGVLYRDAPKLRAVVDLTHGVSPGDVATGAFFLERSWSRFPAGTVHVAVVDPDVGTERGVCLLEARGHVFLAPDNGLVAPLVESEPGAVLRRADERAPVRGTSATFHGRDRFAPLAARLVEGDPPAAFGEKSGEYVRLERRSARRTEEGRVAAEVIHVDRFGNLITNAAPTLLSSELGDDWRAHWVCRVGDERLPLVRTYGEAPDSTAVALVDSFELLEIAVRDGSAARTLSLGKGAEVWFEPADAPAAARPARARKRRRA